MDCYCEREPTATGLWFANCERTALRGTGWCGRHQPRLWLLAVRIPYHARIGQRPISLSLLNSKAERKNAMTAHLLIMYPHPKDVKEFDRAYREEHLPYATPRLKGATGVVTKRVVGPSFAQPPYHLISDVSFPTIETLKATAASSGKEALAHAASISSGGTPTIVVVTDDA
jgi:uncharacterized protein (TIGR02118 family)